MTPITPMRKLSSCISSRRGVGMHLFSGIMIMNMTDPLHQNPPNLLYKMQIGFWVRMPMVFLPQLGVSEFQRKLMLPISSLVSFYSLSCLLITLWYRIPRRKKDLLVKRNRSLTFSFPSAAPIEDPSTSLKDRATPNPNNKRRWATPPNNHCQG